MSKSISIFIGILILGIGEIIFAKIVLKDKIKVSTLKLILTLLTVTSIYTLSSIYLTGVLKTFINCIVHVFEFKYLFKIDYAKSIFLTIMYVVLLAIPDAISLLFFTKVLNISVEICYETYAGNILTSSMICVLFIAQTVIMKKTLRKLINHKLENNKKIIAFSILTLICIAVVFYNAFGNIIFDYNLIVSIFTIVVFITILVSLMKQTIENNNLTKKYEQVLEFMTTYEDEVEKQRVLRHETKNAFLTIKAQLTDKSKQKEIIEYIDSILKEDTKMKYEEYAKFKYLPANGIKGLCYYKIQEAENKQIKVSINISSRINKSVLTKLTIEERKELGKILGVFLDNAIEASKESKEKVLGFEVYPQEKAVKIIISNSYENKIDKKRLGKERYTTKGKNHGHGLLLVKNIISNNKIFETQTEITEKLYIQNIIIKKSTEN